MHSPVHYGLTLPALPRHELPMRRLRAVLFDLDGTLADTAPDLAAAVNAMRTARDQAPLPYEDLRGFASMGARGLLGRGFGIRPEDPGYATMCEEFLANYEAAMLVHTRLFDGMAEVLEAIERAGMRWGVVSNKSERYVRPIIAGLGLDERCGCSIGGDTLSTRKPDPAPLLLGARLVEVDPLACVYIGDDHRDVVAGRAAGMATIAAAYGYCAGGPPPEQWGADHLVDSVPELLPLLGSAR